MVRGNAKKLAQEKNAKKQAEKTTAKSNLGKPNQSLQMKCSVCMAQMKNAKQMRDHFESKHPKLPLPKECEDGEEEEKRRIFGRFTKRRETNRFEKANNIIRNFFD